MTNTKTSAIEEIKAKLEQGITDVMTSDNYRAWLDTISKFHKYSFYNQILITMQKPEATRVAGFNTWKSMERNIKEMQAESVAYIVSNYLGIDTSDYSFNYVAGWSGEKDTQTLKIEMSKITDTARKIIDLLEKVA